MATADPMEQKRMALVQIGVSAFIGLIALFVLQAATDHGLMFWFTLAVALTSTGEVVWFLVKHLRLSRDQERIN